MGEAEIPELDLAMQAVDVPAPVVAWGSRGRRHPVPGGTVHFYVDDYRFLKLARRPVELVATGCAVAVEPNFSTLATMPESAVVELTRRKRAIARAWQSAGIRTLVDLNVAPEWAAANLIGVPRGWRAYATRSHRGVPIEAFEAEHRLACDRAGTDRILFCVVGGGRRVAAACADRGWLRVSDPSDACRGRP